MPFKESLTAERRLIGTWRAIDSSGHLRDGTIGLQSNGIAIIAPDDYQPLIGRWEADAGELHVTVGDQGHSVIAYTLTGAPEVLALTFANGKTQRFVRLPIHKPPTHKNSHENRSSAKDNVR